LILGKPPAEPGRLPKFDSCGKIRKPPKVNRSKLTEKEASNE